MKAKKNKLIIYFSSYLVGYLNNLVGAVRNSPTNLLRIILQDSTRPATIEYLNLWRNFPAHA